MIQLIGSPNVEVVTVPQLLWATNGKGRKIFIECFGPYDKVQAQKDAMVLGHVMSERISTKPGRETEPKPNIVTPL